MNFYAFHIGDYASKTRHLSWDEDLAYRRLIDAYCTREGVLPLDRKQTYRLVMASSKAQRDAVDAVLSEFFTETAEGFRNERCDEEIASARIKREKAAASANKRWGNASPDDPHSGGSAKAMRTHCEGNAPNPNPNPNPNPSKDGGIGYAGDELANLEAGLRLAAGWEREPHPGLCVTGPVHALIQAGCDLELDVFPTVRALAPTCRSRTGWKYFLEAIARARDERLAAGSLKVVPIQPGVHVNAKQKPSSITRSIANVTAAIDAQLAEARAIEGSQ